MKHHHHGDSIHGFHWTIVGIAKINRVRLFSKTAFGQDVATQVATKVIMAMGQNVATKKITAMGQDGATKVEPAIRGLGGGANRGAHRGLGRASTTASREEASREDPTIAHEVRRFPKARRVVAPRD